MQDFGLDYHFSSRLCAQLFNSYLKEEILQCETATHQASNKHHWWPSSISKYWGKDKHGKLTRIAKDHVRKMYPASVGFVNQHNTTSIGDVSFETTLNRLVDSKVAETFVKLNELSRKFLESPVSTPQALTSLNEFDRRNIARYAGSMVVRTPYMMGQQEDREITGKSLGTSGMGAAAGLRAVRKIIGLPEMEPMSDEEYMSTKDIVLRASALSLPVSIMNLYECELVLAFTPSMEGFVFSDAGYFAYLAEGEGYSHFPLLPHVCAIYKQGLRKNRFIPILGGSCDEDVRLEINRGMISRAQRHVFSSLPPSDGLLSIVRTYIGSDFPKPFVRTGNLLHRPRLA